MVKTISIFLSLIVLISSNGIAISTHFCGGKLKDLAFFGEAEKCKYYGLDSQYYCESFETQPSTRHFHLTKKSCCSGGESFFKLDIENLQNVGSVLSHVKIDLPILFRSYFFNDSDFGLSINFSTNNPNGPPLPSLVSKRILYQVFRI
jgi:hypothetical protein